MDGSEIDLGGTEGNGPLTDAKKIAVGDTVEIRGVPCLVVAKVPAPAEAAYLLVFDPRDSVKRSTSPNVCRRCGHSPEAHETVAPGMNRCKGCWPDTTSWHVFEP